MKTIAPVIAAGGTFTVCALGGIMLGTIVGDLTGTQFWVPAGLALGMAAGAYAAVRLLMRSL